MAYHVVSPAVWVVVVLLVAASLVTFGLELAYALVFDTSPAAGSVGIEGDAAAVATTYGFGAEKRLLVINLTAMGGYAQIPESDKKHATMQIYGAKHDPADAPWAGEVFDIGFEYKGGGPDTVGGRIKPNYNFELWEPDGFEADGVTVKYDDAKNELFFDEKLEDFVLRGGFFEPTITRDEMAPRLAGVPYETALVELVLVLPGNEYTYEGVYLLFGRSGRRLSEKYEDWQADGKKIDCEDMTAGQEAAEAAQVSLHFEWDHKPLSDTSDKACTGHSDVLLRYPKCSWYAEQNATRYPDCVAALEAERAKFAALFRTPVDTPVGADLNASAVGLGRVLLAENILLDAGWGADSDLWHVAPADPTTGARELGHTLYDHDEKHWRVFDPSAHGVVVMENNWDLKEHTLFPRLLRHAPFVAVVKARADAWLDAMNDSVDAVFDKRRAEVQGGHWTRNNARWQTYGRRNCARTHPECAITYLYGAAGWYEDSMAAELDFAHDFYRKRIAALRAAAPTLAPGAPDVLRLPTAAEIVFGHLWPFLLLWLVSLLVCLVPLVTPQLLVPCGLARRVPDGAQVLFS